MDYHLIENPFERTAITVHTYGGEMKSCHVFEPRDGDSYDVRIKELHYTSLPASVVAVAPTSN